MRDSIWVPGEQIRKTLPSRKEPKVAVEKGLVVQYYPEGSRAQPVATRRPC
jgi:hypothetical protein